MNKEKFTDQDFRDWEKSVLGYGYGSGEEPCILGLKKFFTLCNHSSLGGAYDYKEIEDTLTPLAAWLCINILCKVGVIDYGCSPRSGWLSDKGIALKEYMLSKTTDELLEVLFPEEDI